MLQDLIWSGNAFQRLFYMHMCTCTGNKGNKLWFEVGVEDGAGVAKDQNVFYFLNILSQFCGSHFQVMSSRLWGN